MWSTWCSSCLSLWILLLNLGYNLLLAFKFWVEFLLLIYCDTNDIGNIVGFWQLWSNDQLSRAVQSGQVFRDFEEGPLMFPPTYKYDVGTDNYDTSSKVSSCPPPGLVPCCNSFLLNPSGDFQLQGWFPWFKVSLATVTNVEEMKCGGEVEIFVTWMPGFLLRIISAEN